MIGLNSPRISAGAFGFNHFRFPPGFEGYEHDETRSGQEEVVVVLEGSGTLRVDGAEVELRPGRLVRLDPAARRQPVAGADGLAFLTIGGIVGGVYEPPSWG